MGVNTFPVASGSSAVICKTSLFTSSGTFTLPSGYGAGQPLIVDIEIGGGGGGGGGGASADDNYAAGPGGGGGSGIVAVYRNVSLTANATITIGAAGTGGTGAQNANESGTAGTSGGTSNVNSLYYAPGGGYGNNGLVSAFSRSANAWWAGNIISNGYNIPVGFTSSL
jgi:hypothetical protein